MSEIEFTIDGATGELTMHVKGVAGPACGDAARIVKELVGDPASERNTPEYYARPGVKSRIQPMGR